MQYANLVGQENLIAGTDRRMGQVHRQTCGAKLQVLVEGAPLASAQLWG